MFAFAGVIRKCAAALISLASLVTCYFAARLGYADYLALDHSPQPTAAAIRLASGNATYFAQLADVDPAHSHRSIQRALALNPTYSSLYLEFADLAEQQHNPALARAYLLRAVALDRTFAPRWQLAEFYARQKDQLHFWPAIRAALATSYDDISPLFELCWQLTPDPATILPRAIPARLDVTRQYLDYLISKHQTILAAPVAARLLAHPTAETTPSLLAYSDLSLSDSNASPALTVWNALAQAKLIPYPALQPARGISFTNPDFSHPFLAHAFDWRLVKPPQVFADRQDSLRFDFSGNQPEQCNLLQQYVPLQPSRAYKLTIRYHTRRFTAADTGLYWQLAGPASIALQPDTALPASESERAQQFTFTTSPQTNLANLQMIYRRTLGTVRMEGVLYLQSVNLEFAQSQ